MNTISIFLYTNYIIKKYKRSININRSRVKIHYCIKINIIVEQKYIGVQTEYEVYMIKYIDSLKKYNV